MEAGQAIGDWIVQSKLGAGGMGEVYACRARSDRARTAAVKILKGTVSEEIRLRFQREAQILADLDHASICRLLDFGEQPPFIAMELVEGRPVDHYLGPEREARLSIPQVVELALQLVDVLTYLHARGVAHRDIKPANLILDGGRWIRLVDFGIALDEQQERLTEQGVALGTLPYVPPEAFEGDRLDGRVHDVYALGATLYAVLAGEEPFVTDGSGARRTEVRAVRAKLHEPCLDPGGEVPEALRELVRQLTLRDPVRRLTRLSDVARALKKIATTTQQQPLPAPDPDEDLVDTQGDAALVAGVAGFSGAAVGFAVATALLTLLGISAGLGWWWLSPGAATERDVVVDLIGVSPDVPVFARLGARIPSYSDDPGEILFSGVPLDPQDLAIRIGPGCDALCPGPDCGACCVSIEETREIVAGTGSQHLTFDVPPLPVPVRRRVVLEAAGDEGLDAWTVHWKVHSDDVAIEGTPRGSRWEHGELQPGPYEVLLQIGTCAEPDADCASGGDCPDRCWSRASVVEVPCGTGDYRAALLAGVPQGTADDTVTAVSTDARPSARSRAGGRAPSTEASTPAPIHQAARRQVTNVELSRWLDAHPEWGRQQAIHRGVADQGYLSGWRKHGPSRSILTEPVTSVSAAVAEAYCASRGGLAQVHDQPRSWSSSAALELRLDESRPMVVAYNMREKEVPGGFDWTDPRVGFRCRR